jgi:predicted ATPase with chaperone activity
MDVRVWSVVEDRLIEVRADRGSDRRGMLILGLPAERAGTTADRVRAALLNSGLVQHVPDAVIRLDPPAPTGATSDLDLALALAFLVRFGLVGAGLRWLLATGRLGLDGTVYTSGHVEESTLSRVVESLSDSSATIEHMFEVMDS